MVADALISVIVPVFKIPTYIDRCVNSIVHQTYSNLEIILVDDGSPDQCPDLCEAWKDKDNRIKVIHKKNGGLSDARNRGMNVAKGTFISFVDGDDWLEARFYEQLLFCMEQTGADMAGVQYRKRTDTDKEVLQFQNNKINVYDKDQAMKKLISNDIQQVVWNKLYRRDLIKDILFEVGKYHEDEFWSYQVFAKVEKYAEISYIGYNYFQRADSIMGESYSIKRLDAIEAKVCRQKFIKKEMPKLEDYARRNLLFACMYQGQMALKYLRDTDKQNAIRYIEQVYKGNYKSKLLSNSMKKTQQIWLALGNLSFVCVCRIRNLLKIGT